MQRTVRVAAGLGVIPRVVKEGVEIYRRRILASEADFRLAHFYRPYHFRLVQLLNEARTQFGAAILIDCHSMPPLARGHDIVIGDCHGEAAGAELTEFVEAALKGLGFRVGRNSPYAGGYPQAFMAARLQAFTRSSSRSIAGSTWMKSGSKKRRALPNARPCSPVLLQRL